MAGSEHYLVYVYLSGARPGCGHLQQPHYAACMDPPGGLATTCTATKVKQRRKHWKGLITHQRKFTTWHLVQIKAKTGTNSLRLIICLLVDKLNRHLPPPTHPPTPPKKTRRKGGKASSFMVFLLMTSIYKWCSAWLGKAIWMWHRTHPLPNHSVHQIVTRPREQNSRSIK